MLNFDRESGEYWRKFVEETAARSGVEYDQAAENIDQAVPLVKEVLGDIAANDPRISRANQYRIDESNRTVPSYLRSVSLSWGYKVGLFEEERRLKESYIEASWLERRLHHYPAQLVDFDCSHIVVSIGRRAISTDKLIRSPDSKLLVEQFLVDPFLIIPQLVNAMNEPYQQRIVYYRTPRGYAYQSPSGIVYK